MIINISGLFAWLVVLSFSTISLGAENEVIPLENGCKLIRPPENSTVPRPWVIFSDSCLHSCARWELILNVAQEGVHQEFLAAHRKFHEPLIERSWKLWPLLYNKLRPPICAIQFRLVVHEVSRLKNVFPKAVLPLRCATAELCSIARPFAQ